jgi:hypothetical protein
MFGKGKDPILLPAAFLARDGRPTIHVSFHHCMIRIGKNVV